MDTSFANRLRRGRTSPVIDLADQGPILRSVLAANSRTTEALRGEELIPTADGIAAMAEDHGNCQLFGASAFGTVLVGAILYSSSALSLWQPGSGGSVLLVDGFLAGIAGLEAAAARMRSTGASDVDAIVLGFVDSASDQPAVRGVNRLWTLERSAVLA